MKIKFFSKILKLCIIIAVLCSISFYFNDRLIKEYSYQCADSTEVLLTGSSLTSWGLDPALIKNSENISQRAEPNIINYFKLREILKQDNSINKIVISTGLQEMNFKGNVFYGKKSVSSEMFSRLVSLREVVLPKELTVLNVDRLNYMEVFIRYRIFPHFNYIKRWLRGAEKKGDSKDLVHSRGFVNGEGSKYSTYNKKEYGSFIAEHFNSGDFNSRYNDINISYIDSIGELCEEKDIELILLAFPIRQEVYRLIPDCYHEYYENFKSNVIEKNNYKFIDYAHLGDSTWFMDYVHLNWKGAGELSKNLNIVLNQKKIVRMTSVKY
ncbi:hypothetical protein [Saccharicrinis sp. 156]|uniref:hypothetical protein n=1 Tax=Saccharicrinis sp. 156 TaxID=3417574 RepID=UPI003D325B74